MRLPVFFYVSQTERLHYVDLLQQEFTLCHQLLTNLGKSVKRLEHWDFVQLADQCSVGRLKQIHGYLAAFNEVMGSMKESDEVSNRRQLWLAFKKLKIHGHHAIVEEFDQKTTEVIEIYSLTGMQLFRTISFFDHCSYELETVFMKPLYHLYDRDPMPQWAVFREIFKALIGLKDNFYFDNVPDHWVNEKESKDRLRIWMKLGVVASLKSKGEFTGDPLILVSSTGEVHQSPAQRYQY